MHITYSYTLHLHNFSFYILELKKGKNRKEYLYQAPLIYVTVHIHIHTHIFPCFLHSHCYSYNWQYLEYSVTCTELDSISRNVIGYDVYAVFLFAYRVYLKNDRNRYFFNFILLLPFIFSLQINFLFIVVGIARLFISVISDHKSINVRFFCILFSCFFFLSFFFCFCSTSQ